MNTETYANATNGAEEQASLTDKMKRMEETCRDCKPISALTCVTDCSIWKLKNEFRTLSREVQNPEFTKQLLNTLKNKRRLQALKIISERSYSIPKLQQELSWLGYHHSQKTIVEEYLNPLMEAKLVKETLGKYQATVFGSRINEQTKGFREVAEALPPHSECYEEKLLMMLSKGPKTYENLESAVPAKSIARTLSRLQAAGLVEAPKERDHVFFFRTQRDPNKETLSPTDRRMHENIPEEGISARRLAQDSKVSLRRTYKYLRRLKGKKLVFARERPKFYALTPKGSQTATVLRRIHDLVAEVETVGAQLLQEGAPESPSLDDSEARLEGKAKMVAPLTTVQHSKRTGVS